GGGGRRRPPRRRHPHRGGTVLSLPGAPGRIQDAQTRLPRGCASEEPQRQIAQTSAAGAFQSRTARVRLIPNSAAPGSKSVRRASHYSCPHERASRYRQRRTDAGLDHQPARAAHREADDAPMTLPRLVPPASIDATATEELRNEVRDFLADQLVAGAFT